ncbi:hypothetical protein FACS1894133_3080 [Clostridia bacterium]|nr:hypothetical protein FACS1894133_3080 [Clostridia bacterium]
MLTTEFNAETERKVLYSNVKLDGKLEGKLEKALQQRLADSR